MIVHETDINQMTVESKLLTGPITAFNNEPESILFVLHLHLGWGIKRSEGLFKFRIFYDHGSMYRLI